MTITVAGRPVAQLGPAHHRIWISGPELAKVCDTPAPQTLDEDLEHVLGELAGGRERRRVLLTRQSVPSWARERGPGTRCIPGMRIIALLVLALLSAPAVAMAKGPLSGTVSGPGLAAPIKLDGSGEWDENSPLALLTADTGIYDHSEHPPRPAGELGPRYEVRLVFPRHSTGKPDYVVRQHLYPYAEHGPTVYTVRGQPIFDDTFRTTGGWYRVPRILIKRLHLPATAEPAVADRRRRDTRRRRALGL